MQSPLRPSATGPARCWERPRVVLGERVLGGRQAVGPCRLRRQGMTTLLRGASRQGMATLLPGTQRRGSATECPRHGRHGGVACRSRQSRVERAGLAPSKPCACCVPLRRGRGVGVHVLRIRRCGAAPNML